MSDRLVRFPGTSWQQIEALPQPLRWTVQRTIFHLLDEPVPTLRMHFRHRHQVMSQGVVTRLKEPGI